MRKITFRSKNLLRSLGMFFFTYPVSNHPFYPLYISGSVCDASRHGQFHYSSNQN